MKICEEREREEVKLRYKSGDVLRFTGDYTFWSFVGSCRVYRRKGDLVLVCNIPKHQSYATYNIAFVRLLDGSFSVHTWDSGIFSKLTKVEGCFTEEDPE